MTEQIPCDDARTPLAVPGGATSDGSRVPGRAHIIHDDGVLAITRTYMPDGYTLSGEIDAATYGALVAALARLAGDADIHLNLAGLAFCDAAGLAAMVGLADRMAAECHVILDGVPAPLGKLLSVVGWESLPNLEVHPR